MLRLERNAVEVHVSTKTNFSSPGCTSSPIVNLGHLVNLGLFPSWSVKRLIGRRAVLPSNQHMLKWTPVNIMVVTAFVIYTAS